jgi:predicted ATPase
MIKAVGALKVPTETKLEVRVGIATGVVVVGDQSSSEVGETPNLAARLQSLAEPGSIVIADSTKKLIGTLFECHDMGTVAVKGYSDPIQAWQVLALGHVESRFEALRSHELTPLVGREEELELLVRRWRQVKEGEGQTVLLSGEPGIGKSRLVTAFAEQIAVEPHTRLQYFFSPYHATSALYPVISQLGHATKFHRDDDAAARLDKLGALLARTGTTVEDAALIADLLALPAKDRYPPLNLTPQQRKDKTFAALLRQLEALTREQPVLMVFEDAHWSDPSSRELLDLTIERIQGLPALLFVTFRPEFEPPWTGQSQVMTLTLSRLNRRNGAVLVKRMVGYKGLPDHIVDDIVERTDGIPLFVEELTKSVMQTGLRTEGLKKAITTAPSPALSVPSTLHAPLMARLDGLGTAKDIVQIGAAIGREFSFELLSAVSERPPNELQADLDKLVEAGLVFQRGMLPHATFHFKHALIQDAAYSTLLRASRQRLHARIAEVVTEQFPETPNGLPEILAQHYAKAGLAEQAAASWQVAGERAVSRSAIEEAIAHFTNGLAAVAQLAEGRKKQKLELDFRLNLAAALVGTRGWASPEYQQQIGLARDLAERLGDQERLFWAMYAQWVQLFARAEHDLALGVAQELMSVAERCDRSIAKSTALYCMGTTALHLGQFISAREYLERSVELDDPRQAQIVVAPTGRDSAVVFLGHLATTNAYLGYAAKAKMYLEKAIDRGNLLSHVPTMALAQIYRFWILGLFFRDYSASKMAAEAVLRLAAEHGSQIFRVLGEIDSNWLQAKTGNTASGIRGMHDALITCRDMGFHVFLPRSLCLLAIAYHTAGEVEEGLCVIGQALSIIEATKERTYEAELLRVRGELQLSGNRPNNGQAEASFLKAIDIARQQSAKTWELRAATSLARLWRDVGRPAEAHDALAQVYGWFTEGSDLPDLKDARTLLDELTPRIGKAEVPDDSRRRTS